MAVKTHEIWNLQFINRIIDAMADGVFTMDTEGRISSWNQSMERISGYSAEEALGKTCQLLQFSRCFGKNCPANIHKCQILVGGGSEVKECQLRHKDGHDVEVIKNASMVKDDQGHIIGVTGPYHHTWHAPQVGSFINSIHVKDIRIHHDPVSAHVMLQ